MPILHTRSKRKVSGGLYKHFRKKRIFESGNSPSFTKLDKRRAKGVKIRGGNFKMRLLSENVINIFDPKSKKYQKVSIKTVAENPANRHFVRRNIITKGAIVETELGRAKVTNRPGQEGCLNGILIS